MANVKVLRVEMPDGTEWDIPAEVIARNRTEYYSAGRGKTYKDGKLVWQEPSFKPGSKEWDEEWKQSMQDDEIMDWAANNMDWKDVKEFAVRVPKKENPRKYDDDWTNAEMRVVTVKAAKVEEYRRADFEAVHGPNPDQGEKLVAVLKDALRESR